MKKKRRSDYHQLWKLVFLLYMLDVYYFRFSISDLVKCAERIRKAMGRE